MALMCSNHHLTLTSPSISKSAAASSMPSASSSSSASPISFSVPRRTANGRVKTQRPAAMLRMGPEEEKLTRRNPLDFPIEWERPKPGRRPDIFPQFSPMKTPLPPPMPYDPPEEDEEEEEKKEEEDPEKEEEENPPESIVKMQPNETRMEDEASRTIQAKLEITEEVMEEEEEEETQGLIVKVDPISQKLEFTVDEVVEEYVGSFGFSQLLHVFLVSIPWIFDAQNTLVTIFTDAQPAAAWRSCTTTTTTAISTCNVGDVVSTSSVCGLVAGSWEWVGGNKTSTIAEWGLICDRKFLAALPASLFFIGSLLGSGFYGWIADVLLGRKKTVVLSCILASITAFLTSLSPNIWIYALLRLANGFARSGIGICCLVLSTEAVGRKWRGQVGQYGFLVFTVGFLSLPLIAYPSRACWRNVYKILSIFPLLYSVLILIPFVSESPRWLLLKGRSKEALDILQKCARLNGKKELPSNLSLAESASDGNAKLMNIFWSTKWAAKRMITLIIAGFGVGCIYYGVQLNVENLDLNLYITVTINAIMEIPAIFIGSILLSFINHRPHFSWSAYIAGVSSIICIVFSRGGLKKKGNDLKGGRGNWAQLSIEGVGLMAASRAFDMLYILCVELFPTNVRNFAVSMLRQSLMLGASVAPLLVVLGRLSPSLSFLLFGILSICSGLLISLWLPETNNAPIYETLDQQQEGEKLNSIAMDQSLH